MKVDDAVAVDPAVVGGSWEGIWWLPRPTADGFLAISNLSSQIVTGHQVLLDGLERRTDVLTLGPHETRLTSFCRKTRKAAPSQVLTRLFTPDF